MTEELEQTLVERLRTRAQIRRNIPARKSVQNGESDRLSDLLEEAADEIEELLDKQNYLETELQLLKCLYDYAQTKLDMEERQQAQIAKNSYRT